MNKQYQKEWREKNKEKTREYCKKYQANNPDKVKESQKKYYYKNIEKKREKSRNYNRLHREEHIKKALEWNKKNPEKFKKNKQNYQKRNPEKRREWMKKWLEKNKERYEKSRKEYHSRPEVKAHYKKKLKEWQLNRREKLVGSPKPELCPVCGRKPVGGNRGKGRICVDHCHKTGKIRGWLCDDCNVALGRVNDRIDILENLIIYLKKNYEDINC